MGRVDVGSPRQGVGAQMIRAVLDHALHADNTRADRVDLGIAVLSTGYRPLGSCSRAAGWSAATSCIDSIVALIFVLLVIWAMSDVVPPRGKRKCQGDCWTIKHSRSLDPTYYIELPDLTSMQGDLRLDSRRSPQVRSNSEYRIYPSGTGIEV